MLALAAFATAFLACWSQAISSFTEPLKLKIVFPVGIPEQIEPLVATGSFGQADFLSVRYVDPETAVLSYDSWGSGGPSSAKFALRPGEKRQLQVEMPTLPVIATVTPGETGKLKVKLDGTTIFEAEVGFHPRALSELYIGANPVGGTPASRFRGKLSSLDGKPLDGSPVSLLPIGTRLKEMLRHYGWNLAVCLGLSGLFGFVVATLPWRTWWLAWQPPADQRGLNRPAPHLAFLFGVLVCVVLFVLLVTGGTFRLTYPDSFGQFYDFQAVSILHGHLDVPEPAVSGEAFVYQGKYYGYFGITPALLRTPFAATHIAFARLSRVMLVLDYVAILFAAYALLCWSAKKVGGKKAWPSIWSVLIVLGCAGLGSTYLFLGSRAYVYHEAIMCGGAFALWSVYCGLRYWEEPEKRWWIGAVILGLFAVNARPPAGMFSLTVLGGMALTRIILAWRHRTPSAILRHLGIGGASVLAFLSVNGIAYLKFHTLDPAPLKYHVQYTPARIAVFEGKNFHASNVALNLTTYVVEPNLHFAPHLPWIRFGSNHPQRVFPEAKMDLKEPTVAMPFAMPALFLLAIGGTVYVLLRSGALRSSIGLLCFGFAPVAAALLMAVASSHRYTGDFCPFLIASATLSVACIDAEATWFRRITLAALSVLAAYSFVVEASLAIHFQSELVWGVPPEVTKNLQRFQAWADSITHQTPH